VSDRYSRRELLGLAATGLLACRADAGRAEGPVRRPGVVGIADLAAAGEGPSVEQGRAALERALVAATGHDSGPEAVRGLFTADDVIGVKVNCLAGRHLSPRVELVEALARLLVAGGVAANRIIVFERSSRELERAGFEIRRSGGPFRCFGIDNDWDARPSVEGSIGSCFARLVSEQCTALVSFGVVKDHDLAGVSAGLKNWYGVIHNPNKYHDNHCDPYVADVARHLRRKLRLTVLDGVTAQCQGGPAFHADGVFPLARVAVSTDPVAADAWAWAEIDAERGRRKLPTLEQDRRAPRFLATASGYGLGVGDPARIERVKA
jgi:hypothetical protein